MSSKKSMKICLTTYFDKNFSELGELCLKSMRKYAKKYGYDVKTLNNISSKRPPAWNKVLVIQRLLEDKKNYDFIFWIDSDALFINFNEDIKKEIAPGKDFYIAKHSFSGENAPNSGVMLIKNTKWSRDFLQAVWDNSEYIFSIGWENSAINNLLGFNAPKNKIRDIFQKVLYKLKIKNYAIKILNKMRISGRLARFFIKLNQDAGKKEGSENKFLGKIKWLDKKWNSLPYYEPVKNPIINHYPSLNYETRLEKMHEDAKKAEI